MELADGSKVQSAHKAPNVTIVVGKTVCKVDFTVTVLGINWLALLNPVIDWKLQKMNIWIGREWNQIQGLLLHSNYNTGTIKDFAYCGAEKTGAIPDFIKMKEPAFWEYNTGKKIEWNRTSERKDQDCIIPKKASQTKESKSKNVIEVLGSGSIHALFIYSFSVTSSLPLDSIGLTS